MMAEMTMNTVWDASKAVARGLLISFTAKQKREREKQKREAEKKVWKNMRRN